MPHTIQQPLDVPPSVLVEVTGLLDLPYEAAQMAGSLSTLLNGCETDVVYLIIDVSRVEMSLSGLMMTLSTICQEWERLGLPCDVHQRMRFGVVGSSDLIRLVVDGLSVEQSGIRQVRMFRTTAEALAYANKAWTVTQILKKTVSRKREDPRMEAGRAT